MLRPFVAYLRVYEPLSAFGDPPDGVFIRAVEAAELTRAAASEREHLLWCRSQLSAPVRLLPAEFADRRPTPSTKTDVLVLDPADVPGSDAAELRREPLVCPLEIRVRSAAALVGFLDEAHPALRVAALEASGVSAEAARARANAAMRDLYGPTMHVLSTTWTVPLPWFSLVDPDQRRLVLGDGPQDPTRELSWRATMSDARRRAADAQALFEGALGDAGPTRILTETGRWLSNFHPDSAVELDYGGLVQLIEDPVLATDTSADEVHTILEALRNESIEELAESFQSLREYWGELAAREQNN